MRKLAYIVYFGSLLLFIALMVVAIASKMGAVKAALVFLAVVAFAWAAVVVWMDRR